MVIEMNYKIELDDVEVAILGAVLANEVTSILFNTDATDEERAAAKGLTELGLKIMQQAIKQKETNEQHEN